MRKFLPAACAALVMIAVTAVPVIGAGAPPPEQSGPVGTTRGWFHAECTFSHRLPDDPIVFPRAPGASHPHDFFGATTTNAMSTNESVAQGPTNCYRYDTKANDVDHSSYWTPTLYVNNKAVRPSDTSVHYSSGVRYVQSIEAFPKGLRMITGTATGGPQNVDGERVWIYQCRQGTRIEGTVTVAPTCLTNHLELVIRFPDCWDGMNLDSPDHKSHMAFSRREVAGPARVCPPTHPRVMPQLELLVRYPTLGGRTVKLASGAINTAHADFMNGWDQAKLEALVRDCLVTDQYCGGGDVPVGGH